MTARLDVSVIVPTRDRPALVRGLPARLAMCELEGLTAELVVVDDGSREAIAPLLAGAECFGEPVRVLRQGRHGPARARNLGANAARGALLVFFADDLECEAAWIAAHRRGHGAAREHAVLGPIEPPSAGGDTPFDRFLWRERVHFDYAAVAREAPTPEGVSFARLYASNLSVPRDLLLRVGGFDAAFPGAALEDVELGFRLARAGVRVGFEPAARARALGGCGSDLARYLRWREQALPSAYRAMRLAPPLADLVARPTRPRWRGVGHRAWSATVGVLGALDRAGVPLPDDLYRRLLGHVQPLRTAPPAAETPLRAGRFVRDPITGRMRFDSRGSDSVIAGELLLEALRPFRRRVAGRVLDLGCGDGPLRAPLELAADGYLGVDRSPRATAASVRADAAALPFAGGTFDGVVVAEVLEHVVEPRAVLAEAFRVARAGASVLVTAPFFYRIHDAPEDRWRFTEDGLGLLVREAGFELLQASTVGGAGSVVADLLSRNLMTLPGVALEGLGARARSRWLSRAGGALTHRLSVWSQRAFLLARRLALRIATRQGRVNRLTCFLWDRSSRMAKGYVLLARKP